MLEQAQADTNRNTLEFGVNSDNQTSGLISSRLKNHLPVFTSTPILQSQDVHTDNIEVLPIYRICRKLDQVESELKELKHTVISNIERKISDLKSTMIKLLDEVASENNSYASVVQRQINTNQSIDEGFCNNSPVDISVASGLSHTCVKTVYVPSEQTTLEDRNCDTFTVSRSPPLTSSQTHLKSVCIPSELPTEIVTERVTEITGQTVPVRITTRASKTTEFDQCRPATTCHDNKATTPKTLLIGDSVLHGINTKGLIKGVQKHSRGGATVNEIIEEIGVYDIKSFNKIIIYVGGNDCAKYVDQQKFEEKYDQLISLIKASNGECDVYLCKIAPRGDTDVTIFNNSIERLATYWEHQNVSCIEETHTYFYGKNNIPASRYFGSDGIHLSMSGLKRFLNALDITVKLVVN